MNELDQSAVKSVLDKEVDSRTVRLNGREDIGFVLLAYDDLAMMYHNDYAVEGNVEDVVFEANQLIREYVDTDKRIEVTGDTVELV